MTKPSRYLGKNYSEFIGAMRWVGNTTQEEFAAAVGVLPQTVARWERGTSVPQRRNRDMIADVLELSEEEKIYLGNPNAAQPLENIQHNGDVTDYRNQLLGALMLRAEKGPALSTIEGIILMSLIDDKNEQL